MFLVLFNRLGADDHIVKEYSSKVSVFNEGISDFFISTIGVKQGCPLSPTLFGLLIDELEHKVIDFMQQEGIEEVMIGNAVIMLLLYADDVGLLAHSLEDAQKLMIALENFCLHSGLIVNGSKTKVMVVKTLNKEKPCIVYNKEPLEVVESFKYLGVEVSANHVNDRGTHFLSKVIEIC
ncbi:hypothetical protein L7F22_062379 [Adiantum nelumboides]|nr:hypothetical protein [Adiantum nelumboides]